MEHLSTQVLSIGFLLMAFVEKSTFFKRKEKWFRTFTCSIDGQLQRNDECPQYGLQVPNLRLIKNGKSLTLKAYTTSKGDNTDYNKKLLFRLKLSICSC